MGRPASHRVRLPHEPPPSGTRLVAIYQKAVNAGMYGPTAGIRRDVEAIYIMGDWGRCYFGGGTRSSVFKTAMPYAAMLTQKFGHPHAKPQDVMEPLIGLHDGVVADPFAGSGSTLVAAKAMGRKAIGVEINEQYAEIAARRLSQDVLFTGPAN